MKWASPANELGVSASLSADRKRTTPLECWASSSSSCVRVPSKVMRLLAANPGSRSKTAETRTSSPLAPSLRRIGTKLRLRFGSNIALRFHRWRAASCCLTRASRGSSLSASPLEHVNAAVSILDGALQLGADAGRDMRKGFDGLAPLLQRVGTREQINSCGQGRRLVAPARRRCCPFRIDTASRRKLTFKLYDAESNGAVTDPRAIFQRTSPSGPSRCRNEPETRTVRSTASRPTLFLGLRRA